MNKIFKVIYNKAKHCYVVACEFAKSYSKGGGCRSLRRACAALCIAAAVYAAAGSALANSGGEDDGYYNYIGKANTNPPYTVTIDSGFNGSVYGHKESSEEVSEASVTISGGTVKDYVYGGYSESGNTNQNSVNISGGYMVNAYGAWNNTGNAENNSVKITGGKVALSLYGVHSYSGSVVSNSVEVSNGTLDDIICGYSTYGIVASNSVNFSGGEAHSVYGGWGGHKRGFQVILSTSQAVQLLV